jgi:FAD/FMN-containing dehydrogenase
MTNQDAARLELTNARLVVNDWHVCASAEELDRWRAAQSRLIAAARAVEDVEQTVVRIGDVIRFSARMLNEMTKEAYPLVQVESIRTADNGSKIISVRKVTDKRL